MPVFLNYLRNEFSQLSQGRLNIRRDSITVKTSYFNQERHADSNPWDRVGLEAQHVTNISMGNIRFEGRAILEQKCQLARHAMIARSTTFESAISELNKLWGWSKPEAQFLKNNESEEKDVSMWVPLLRSNKRHESKSLPHTASTGTGYRPAQNKLWNIVIPWE